VRDGHHGLSRVPSGYSRDEALHSGPDVLHALVSLLALRVVETEARLEDRVRLALVGGAHLYEISGNVHPGSRMVLCQYTGRLSGAQERAGVDGGDSARGQKACRPFRLLPPAVAEAESGKPPVENVSRVVDFGMTDDKYGCNRRSMKDGRQSRAQAILSR
jgi:hypothetical protein